MKKILLLLGLFILTIFVNFLLFYIIFSRNYKVIKTKKVLSELEEMSDNNKQFYKSSAPFVLGEYSAEVQLGDSRASNLKNFFRKHNSSLYDLSEFIVKISDKYGFDYRLLPAIAMQESNLCRYIPDDSYNCWGWGIYTGTVTKFSSYEEAIEAVAAGLKKEYIDKGYITASSIMQKYTPSSNGSWANGVNTFLKILQ